MGNTLIAADGPITLSGIKFHYKPPLYRAITPLPGVFHRKWGSSLVMREPNLVRFFGDPEIARRGLIVNGYAIHSIVPRDDGWQGILPLDARISDVPYQEPAISQLAVLESVTDGSKAYSGRSAAQAIQDTLGKRIRLFGNAVSDRAIVALTWDGLDHFLAQDTSDRLDYILDEGGRNYDCENFAETLRSNLSRRYGINGCAIIWGDSHAWNAFLIVSDGEKPHVVMVEPQSDQCVLVKELIDTYAIERRAEVML